VCRSGWIGKRSSRLSRPVGALFGTMSKASKAKSSNASVDSSDNDTTTAAPQSFLSEQLVANREQLYKIPLTPLNCSFGVVTEKDDEIQNLSDIVQLEAGVVRAQVTVVFAIRRPG
jgi:hypothetical protein